MSKSQSQTAMQSVTTSQMKHPATNQPVQSKEKVLCKSKHIYEKTTIQCCLSDNPFTLTSCFKPLNELFL